MRFRITAQDVTDRNPKDLDDPEPISVTHGRNSKIAEIQQSAVSFVDDFLLDFDFPSSPLLRLGKVTGFEDTSRTLYDTIATIIVTATVVSLSGQKIRLDLAVPLVRGELQRPTIAYYNEKPYVFSQDFLDDLVASKETTIPIITKPMTPAQHIYHRDNIQQPLFSAPQDPTDWSLLLTERY